MSIQKRFKKVETISSEKRLLSPKQAGVYLGVSIDIVYEMIHARQIPYIVKPGKRNPPQYLLDRVDLDRWIERRKISAVA